MTHKYCHCIGLGQTWNTSSCQWPHKVAPSAHRVPFYLWYHHEDDITQDPVSQLTIWHGLHGLWPLLCRFLDHFICHLKVATQTGSAFEGHSQNIPEWQSLPMPSFWCLFQKLCLLLHKRMRSSYLQVVIPHLLCWIAICFNDTFIVNFWNDITQAHYWWYQKRGQSASWRYCLLGGMCWFVFRCTDFNCTDCHCLAYQSRSPHSLHFLVQVQAPVAAEVGEQISFITTTMRNLGEWQITDTCEAHHHCWQRQLQLPRKPIQACID